MPNLHRKWLVMYAPHGDESDVEYEVCADEPAARRFENSLAPHGFDADVYQLLDPRRCAHCDRGGASCQCENDE